jgi:hypothetical protein
MIKTHAYPYVTVLAGDNDRQVHDFLRDTELMAGSVTLLLERSRVNYNFRVPQDIARLQALLNEYLILSETFSVRLPWIEWVLARTIEEGNSAWSLAVKIARLWHLASGRNALEHHGEILDLCRVAPPNGLRVNIAQETPRVAGSALPAIAWIEYYDSDYRASDICKESMAIPPQSDSPEVFMGQAQRSFAYHKLCNCNDWTEPLRHIRYCIIAAALQSPAVAEILIRYAVGLTPADCAERSSLFEQYPGKPASQPT